MLNVLWRYALSRQGHKPAPMRLISPDEVAELVPILNMNNVSIMPPTCVSFNPDEVAELAPIHE